MSRFLEVSGRSFNNGFDLLDSTSIYEIQKIINDEIIDPITNKIYDNLINPPPFAGSKVYIVADFAALSALTNVLEGSFGITQDDNESYIFDPPVWFNVDLVPKFLSTLEDTNINNLSNNNIISYDSLSSKWINRALTLETINDINLVNVTTGESLIYLNGVGWTNSKLQYVLNSLNDTTITTPTTNDILIYTNNNKFENKQLILNDLNDCIINTSLPAQGIFYNGSKWTNQDVTFSKHTDISFTTLNELDYMIYNGSVWTNEPFPILSLDNLSDVSVNAMALETDDILMFSNGQFRPDKIYLSKTYDVLLSTQLQGHTLVYNSTTSQYNNDFLNINYIKEINVVNPLWNQFLRFNGTEYNLSYVNTANINDMNITTPALNNIFVYDQPSLEWKNQALRLDNDIIQDVDISLVKNNETLFYRESEGKWVNGHPVKEVVYITASRPLNPGDFDKILVCNTDLGIIRLTTFREEFLRYQAYIEIYNTSNTLIYIDPSHDAPFNTINNNRGFNYCGYYSKLTQQTNINWTFETNNNNVSTIFKNIVVIPSQVTEMLEYSENHVFAHHDSDTFILSYQNIFQGRVYKKISYTLGLLNTLETFNLRNATNILKIGNAHYSCEWSLNNIAMIVTTNFFNTFLSPNGISLLTNGTVSRNMVYNVETERINVAFLNNVNVLNMGFYQLSNGNTGNEAINLIIPGGGQPISDYKIIMGFHKGFGVVSVLSKNLSLITGVSEIVGGFEKLEDNQSSRVGEVDLQVVENDNKMDDFYYITLTTTGSIKLYKMNAINIDADILEQHTISLLFEFPSVFKNNLVFNSAVKKGSFIYIIANGQDDRIGDFIWFPTLIKFNVDDYSIKSDFNPFSVKTDQSSGRENLGSICRSPSGLLHVVTKSRTVLADIQYEKYASVF